MNDKVCVWHADKDQNFLQVDTIILGVCNQAYPKYPKYEVCISLQSLLKTMQDEVDFLPADKLETFLPDDNITLVVHSQTCSKYPKQQVCNTFAISQGKREGLSWFFCLHKRQSFPLIDIILGLCGQVCPNYPNNKSDISLQYLE